MPLTGSYDVGLVALSVVIAILAAGAALDLASRVTATHGRSRFFWLAGGAFAMGLGIWSMHFTGMLAFRLPVPVRYHVATVALSLLAAISASGVALFVVSRERMDLARLAAGSAVMGAGIAAMHYVGMAAMQLPARARWDLALVALSVAIAIVISFVALRLAFRFRAPTSAAWAWDKLGAALLMGAATPSMHYTGMAAVRYIPAAAVPDLAGAVPVTVLGGGAIVVTTFTVLGLAILLSIVDRRFAAQAGALQAALAEVKTLRGLLPICASCKRIRDEDGRWDEVESYVRARSEAEFSHGICPDCQRKLYPDYFP